MKVLFVLAFVAQVAVIYGHGAIKVPKPRDTDWWRATEPLFGLKGPKKFEDPPYTSYSSTAMRCRDNTKSSPIVSLTAGRPITVTWGYQKCSGCNHVGDCSLYISYDANTANPQYWTKIAQFPGCAKMKKGQIEPNFVDHTFTVPIPQYLPSCEHCVLRWEWVGVQDQAASTPEIEYYANCVDIKIIGDNKYPVPPAVSISGTENFPNDPKKFRDAYGEWSPWVPQIGHKYIVGPALWACAQPGGYVDTGTGTPTPAPAPCPYSTPSTAPMIVPDSNVTAPTTTIGFTLVLAGSVAAIQADKANYLNNLRLDLASIFNIHPAQFQIGAIQDGAIGGSVTINVYIMPASTTAATAGVPSPRDLSISAVSQILADQYAAQNSTLYQGAITRNIVSDNGAPTVASATVSFCSTTGDYREQCPAPASSDSNGPNVGLIVGVVCGVVGLIVLIAVVVVVVRRRQAAPASQPAENLRPAGVPMSHA